MEKIFERKWDWEYIMQYVLPKCHNTNGITQSFTQDFFEYRPNLDSSDEFVDFFWYYLKDYEASCTCTPNVYLDAKLLDDYMAKYTMDDIVWQLDDIYDCKYYSSAYV